MTNETIPETPIPLEDSPETPESTESFGDLLSQFEQTHKHKSEDGAKQLEGTVVSVSADSVFLDIGYKIEGALLRSAFKVCGRR